MMVGIAYAQSLSQYTPLIVEFLLAAGCLAAAACFAGENRWLWAISICVAAFFIGALRMQVAQANMGEISSTTPREAELSLEIESLFNTRDAEWIAGIATVRAAPPYLPGLIGSRLYFSLDNRSGQTTPIAGERYRCFGVVRAQPFKPEPGSFESYLQSQLVTASITQGRLSERQATAAKLSYWLRDSRNALGLALSRNKRPDSDLTGAYKAMLLGQKHELSPDQRQLFLNNGTMHLFAISGLHIGVIAACIHYLLTLCRVKRRSRPLITLVTVLAFIATTGGSASSWRALLMIACFYFVHATRRQVSPLNALALSALIYLLILPNQLLQAGFQMSYLTVASILLFGVPLSNFLNRKTPLFAAIPPSLRSWPQRRLATAKTWLVNGTAISTAAFMTSGLLGLYYFRILPTYGIPINLIAIPLASLAIIAGFISLISSALLLFPLSALFNNAAIMLIAIIQWVLEAISAFPGASLAVDSPSPYLFIGCTLFVFALAGVSYAKTGTRWAAAWLSAPPLATALSIGLIVAWQ